VRVLRKYELRRGVALHRQPLVELLPREQRRRRRHVQPRGEPDLPHRNLQSDRDAHFLGAVPEVRRKLQYRPARPGSRQRSLPAALLRVPGLSGRRLRIYGLVGVVRLES